MASTLTYSVSAPFGTCSVQNLSIAGGTQTFKIQNAETLIASTIGLTANTTISISADTNLPIGSELFVHATASGAQYTVAFTGAILGATQTVGTGSNLSQAFFYDGAKFYPQGSAVIQ